MHGRSDDHRGPDGDPPTGGSDPDRGAGGRDHAAPTAAAHDDADAHPGGSDPERPGAGGWRARAMGLASWVVVLGLAFGAAVGVRAHVAEFFYIPSPSMEPTLRPGDRVLVDKVSYRTGAPRRGDLIVLRAPESARYLGEDVLVKRVIARGGDVVEATGGVVAVDDRPLDEPYLRPGTVTTDIARQEVPAGELWVMGDNRGLSEDSRAFGSVDEDLVVGRAVLRVWPLGDWSRLGG